MLVVLQLILYYCLVGPVAQGNSARHSILLQYHQITCIVGFDIIVQLTITYIVCSVYQVVLQQQDNKWLTLLPSFLPIPFFFFPPLSFTFNLAKNFFYFPLHIIYLKIKIKCLHMWAPRKDKIKRIIKTHLLMVHNMMLYLQKQRTQQLQLHNMYFIIYAKGTPIQFSNVYAYYMSNIHLEKKSSRKIYGKVSMPLSRW